MPTEVAARADFSRIRYAQCWEDADVLLEGLDIREGDVCVAIASAGDNVLAMLSRKPAQVIAVDLNPAQLACLKLKTAAYRVLSHPELLELMGSRPSAERLELYRRCRHHLSPPAKDFWDARPRDIACGIGSTGKFERYLALFRRLVLPAIHSRQGAATAKGAHKGFFEVGGSTIVLVFEKGAIRFDDDLPRNTRSGLETYVRLGESVGRVIAPRRSGDTIPARRKEPSHV